MKRIIFSILFLILLFGTIKILLPGLNDTPCILKDKFLNLDINGVVIKKYIDSTQHSYPIIEIQNNDKLKSISKINLVLERSGLFEKIHKLDFLCKHKDSSQVFVVNGDNFRLIGEADFGCTEKLK